MKILLTIRHAKSSWANSGQKDYDRPLNDRGRRDAPAIGAWLKAQKIAPDLIIASTAARAAETARLIASALGYPEAKIHWEDKLYHASPTTITEVVREISAEVNTAFIVAHNPGITQFASELDGNFPIPHMPTCAIAGAELKAEDWRFFVPGENKTVLFQFPKNL